ncbi:MAG: DNA topoisomerase 1 [Phycisphaerae bacterium]|nr:DNA topoisomerase 1 [Phycisphaerae bacterium]
MAKKNTSSTNPADQASTPKAKKSAKIANANNNNTLVIVESPAKARTISRFLGEEYTVESSIGHIRDLPSKAAEIPSEYKEEEWARLGVDVNDNFKPLYVIPPDKQKQVNKLRQLMKKASRLLLATDEDREGEAIAWHLLEVLQPQIPAQRMVFDEITQTAILQALQQVRDIDLQLVNAQEARRILDRLYGYEVSPVLWRKVGPGLSAGRVQSVATRLIVDRERARMRFRSAEYWDLLANLQSSHQESFTARLIELDGRRLAEGKDFEETTGLLKSGSSARWLKESEAQALAERIRTQKFAVSEVSQKPFTSRPPAPFITSTLQQEADRKLRFSAQRTMRAAQSLYENGYITYMRTDSTNLSQQALTAARSQISELFGQEYLPDRPRSYQHKVKNAQEAHEAIRPAGASFRTPRSLQQELGEDGFKIYELIWKRTLACQMNDAQGQRTTIRLQADGGSQGTAVFTASGKVINFAGYLRAYVEGSDDPEADLSDQEKILPNLKVGDQVEVRELLVEDHRTQPPARYTEASLIQELEQRGIGRPSTYASIIQTIQDRGYVWKKGTALVPTFTAFAVTNLMERHLTDLVDYGFTAKMEDDLDAIASGQQDSTPWLKDFYFGHQAGGRTAKHFSEIGLKALIGSSAQTIDPRAIASIPLGKTTEQEEVVIRVGRYGPYIQIGDSDKRATIPENIAPDELNVEKAQQLVAQASQLGGAIGHDPQTNKPVYLKSGRFGPYVQLGDPELTEKGTIKRGGRPKMASLWPTMKPETLTLEQALLLLSFPKVLGRHPESGEMVAVQDGRFGPFVKMGEETRSLTNHEQLATITLEQALELLKQPKGRGRSMKPQALAEIGTHPQSGAKIQLKSGRYGYYVTDGVVNATLPKGQELTTITLEQALSLLQAREQKMRDQGQDPRAAQKKTSRRSSRPVAKKS